MKQMCPLCNRAMVDGESRILRGRRVCDDCYMDAILPTMPKAHYANDAEFMNRLKDSYPARPQRYH